MITYGQLLVAVSVPTIVALIGVLLNQSGIHGLRAEMNNLRSDMNGLHQHLVDHIIRHEGKISGLEQK